jgi:hypothetical protein
MTPDEAWAEVLRQLKGEMPRSSFQTWVADARVLSLAGDVMTLGTRNTYARDWLESRLTKTIEGMLTGIWNRAVAVRFVVDDPPEMPDDEEESGPQQVLIEPVQYIDYEQVVQPHKQVVVKGYLRRLGVEIGAKAVWLYIGFHQAAWRGGKAGTLMVRSLDVLRFSGISDGAFWRLMRDPDMRARLAGLVERVDSLPMRLFQRGRDGRPHRAPVRYRVFLTPRLTRRDARALHQALIAGIAETGSLQGALRALLAHPNLLEGILPPATGPVEVDANFSQLHTVMEVARAAGGADLDEPTAKLCQELHRRTVDCLGEIHIRHYFIERVMPALQLSPAQAWLVTVARDMAYLNWRTGERRERVTFPGGYVEMAALAGIARYKTIQEWFSTGWKASNKGGDIARFFSEMDGPDAPGDLRIASLPRTYRVLLDEPVLDAGGGIKLDANGGIMADAGGGIKQTPMAGLVDADGGIMVDANGGVKNTLTTAQNTKKKTTATSHPLPGTTPAAGADAPLFWELKPLLQRNLVHPKVQRELLEMEASVQGLVSWVLFACSPAAARLNDPLGYALSQLRADPLTSAGGLYDRLAALPPAELLHLIDSTPQTNAQRYSKRSDHPLWPAWKATMGDMNRAVMQAREILFGKGASES